MQIRKLLFILLLTGCASTATRNVASDAVSSSPTVNCSSRGESGKYQVSLSWKTKGELIAAQMSGSIAFSGDLKVFQQAMGIDPHTGEKVEHNKYWDPAGSGLQLDIVETDLTTAKIIKPETVNLVCE